MRYHGGPNLIFDLKVAALQRGPINMHITSH